MKLFTSMLLLILSGNVFAHKGAHVAGDSLAGILHLSDGQALIFAVAGIMLLLALAGGLLLARGLRKDKAATSDNR